MSEKIYQGYERILELVRTKNSTLPIGISLKIDKHKYLRFQFIDPASGKRTSKDSGCKLTEDGIIIASAKAIKISEALNKCTKASEFWQWYDKEILSFGKELEKDLITYREIFTQIEDSYFNGSNKNTKRKRSRDIPNDVTSFKRYYGDVFELFSNLDKYPQWDELKSVLYHWKQGTKQFRNAYYVIKQVCEYCPNKQDLLDKLAKIDATQTEFRDKQSISLDEFLTWYDTAYSAINGITYQQRIEARVKWLWVASMCVVYGLRPTEVASAQNLTKPVTVDGVTIPALNDPKNKELLLYLGEFTYFGISIKTGSRICKPMTTDKTFIDRLRIQYPELPIYTPKPNSKPESICVSFDNIFSNRMKSYNCPVTQLYAFRHLANQLGEKYGIPQEIRARMLGHSVQVNEAVYKKRSNVKTTIDLLTNHSKQPLSLDMAKQALTHHGFDIHSPEIKTILRIIYQLTD